MLVFAVVKLEARLFWLLSIYEYTMTTLKLNPYTIAFIFTNHGLYFLQNICFVKLYPHSPVMGPTGQEKHYLKHYLSTISLQCLTSFDLDKNIHKFSHLYFCDVQLNQH